MTKLEELQQAFAQYPVKTPLKANKAIYTIILDEVNKRYVIRKRTIRGLNPSAGRSYITKTRITEMGKSVADFVASVGGLKTTGWFIEFEAVFPLYLIHAHFQGWTTFRNSLNLKSNKDREKYCPVADIYRLTHKKTGLAYYASLLKANNDPPDTLMLRRLAGNSRLALMARVGAHTPHGRRLGKMLTASIQEWNFQIRESDIPSHETQRRVRALNDNQHRFNTVNAIFF